jgi:hypothetical protein
VLYFTTDAPRPHLYFIPYPPGRGNLCANSGSAGWEGGGSSLARALWGSVCECQYEACRLTLQAILEHLEVEYFKSEKSVRFLRFSRFWHYFQICNIPLLSAPNRHTKSVSTFSGLARRELGGGGGRAAATICSQSPGNIHHIFSFPIVRHLVRPLVATYGSCFLACQVISSQKPYKGWISSKMPEAT